MIKKTLLLFLVSIITCSTLFADAPSTPAHDGGEWLIIDGTRNFSYAMARLLVSQNIPCTLVVKPADMYHIALRFDNPSTLNVVTLDYTKESAKQALVDAAAGKKYLYLDPEHGKFLEWHETVPKIALHALIAARTHNLTVFYAGRVYPMNKETHITSQSDYAPMEKLTEQGKTLLKIEKMIRLMAEKKLVKTRIIRTGYPFGAGMYDYLLSSSFKDIPKNGMFTWLYTVNKKHQFCYTHDAARCAYLLSTLEHTKESYLECIPLEGYTYNSVKEFADAIVSCSQKMFRNSVAINHRTVNRTKLNLVSKFEPNALRGVDLADFFRNPAIIDGKETQEKYGLTPTPIEHALRTTLLWYATNKDTKGLFTL